MDTCLIYMTAPDVEEAGRVARTVVEERLAACANISERIHSFYRWNGEVCESNEALVVLKTAADRREALMERIRELHSYECPCIVSLPISDGNKAFLEWIAAETRPG